MASGSASPSDSKERPPAPASVKGKQINQNPEEKAKLMKFVQKLRKEAKPGAKLTQLNLSDDDLEELYDKMTCQDCNKIPNPYNRYRCPRGHFYCKECVEKRGDVLEVNGETHGICGFKMSPDNLTRVGYGHGMLAVDWKKNLTKEEIKIVKGSKAKDSGTCLLKVTYFPQDPIFTQVFQNSEWKCPNCAADIKGSEAHRHIRACLSKVKNLF